MKKINLLFLVIAIVTSSTLNAQVSINTDGSSADPSAMLDIKSANKGFLPPRMDQFNILTIQNPAEGLVVYNTTSKTLNVYIGTMWKDMMGNTVEVELAIGEFYQGGVVFYLDGSGGGLVCAVSDQDGGSGIQWYNGNFTTTSAYGTSIGTGQANTTAIINNQGAGSYAAIVCDNYTIGAYSDWFLPSKDELNEMFQNKAAIDATATANGGTAFVSANYWSSTEVETYYAWLQDFIVGIQDLYWVDDTHRVRAVRAF